MATLVWFTHDLRLNDHPALQAALERGEAILPIYLVQPTAQASTTTGEATALQGSTGSSAGIPARSHQPQGAAMWWLHHSLCSLNNQLEGYGGQLFIHQGEPQSLVELAKVHGCEYIHFSHSHEPALQQQQKDLNTLANQHGITCKQFGGRLLNLPTHIFNKQGNAFQVFTPFYKACLAAMDEPYALDTRAQLAKVRWKYPSTKHDANTTHIDTSANTSTNTSLNPNTCTTQNNSHPLTRTEEALKVLNWLPTQPDWACDFSNHWEPGELGAIKRLEQTIKSLGYYGSNRDMPSKDGTSRLAAHMRFGEISPRTLWQTVKNAWPAGEAEPFLRQLIWRDFSYYLLHHHPHIIEAPFKPAFKNFPWQNTNEPSVQAALKRWQKGLTGYPLVDAGMRQLWQTGWMHNRIRMVVASFLTKHLQIHWAKGADWFWDTLLDADPANNTAGWQWVAGCGADAAPYFRIFNPITQSEKFDPKGDYIRQYVPELAKLPDKHIHTPWLAPKAMLDAANITLDKDYPSPMVDHKTARTTALNAYAAIKN